MDSYGIFSLLPVTILLVISIVTKRTLMALICGLAVASLILGGPAGFADNFFGHLYSSFSNETLQWIVFVVSLFGILIALFEKSNAVHDFGTWASKFIKTKRQALLGTFVLGVIIFVDDYLNNLAVATTMKKITDKLGIPRTQLGYVVSTVAAPVCILIPLSSWAVYFSGLLEADGITVGGTGMGAYISGLPLLFYGWAAILLVLLHVLGIMPKLGLIKKDSRKALETGNVFPEGVEPPAIAQAPVDRSLADENKKAHPWNFLGPLFIMIAVTLLTDIDVLKGTSAGVVSAIIMYLLQRKMKFKDLLDACYEGICSMTYVIILLVLAFAVQNANLELKLAEYIISVAMPVMTGGLLPAIVFIVCALYAYATGCFWDMAVIVTPIVLPLALAMGVDPILAGAAVFSGAAFGSNTCLYGDAMILCSRACDIRAIDLMMAILPYALIAGGASTILFLIFGFVM